MAQSGNPAQPRSMTLMAGPIDRRVNPTKVNELANKRDIAWFERMLTATVPMRYPGAFRHVYPGFVQLAAFMTMNIDRHVKAHKELYDDLANGELEKAATTKASTTNISPCSISPPNSIWKRVRHISRSTRCRWGTT